MSSSEKFTVQSNENVIKVKWEMQIIIIDDDDDCGEYIYYYNFWFWFVDVLIEAQSFGKILWKIIELIAVRK